MTAKVGILIFGANYRSCHTFVRKYKLPQRLCQFITVNNHESSLKGVDENLYYKLYTVNDNENYTLPSEVKNYVSTLPKRTKNSTNVYYTEDRNNRLPERVALLCRIVRENCKVTCPRQCSEKSMCRICKIKKVLLKCHLDVINIIKDYELE